MSFGASWTSVYFQKLQKQRPACSPGLSDDVSTRFPVPFYLGWCSPLLLTVVRNLSGWHLTLHSRGSRLKGKPCPGTHPSRWNTDAGSGRADASSGSSQHPPSPLVCRLPHSPQEAHTSVSSYPGSFQSTEPHTFALPAWSFMEKTNM